MEKIQSVSSRQWIHELGPGEDIHEYYLMSAASQQQAKNGPFWRLELQDASGSLEARIWFPYSQQYTDLTAGHFAQIEGRSDSFRDKLQINISHLRVVPPEEAAGLAISDFLPASARPPQAMLEDLERLCRKELVHRPWRRFILSVLRDESIRQGLLTAPAAKAVHHAWVGGLLEHTLSVATLCLRFCDHYPELDRQTLLAGAICHDLGKIWELSGGLVNDYTDEGRLVGHIYLCLEKVGRYLDKSGLSPELAMHFRHLILSHHGQYEYGSPRLPQTAEALALHYADNLDAKMTQCRSLFPDASTDSSGDWSPYQKTLERQIFRAPQTPLAEPVRLEKTEKSTNAVRLAQCSLL